MKINGITLKDIRTNKAKSEIVKNAVKRYQTYLNNKDFFSREGKISLENIQKANDRFIKSHK